MVWNLLKKAHSTQDEPVLKKTPKSNNLFLCSFSTLNKSYWTFPDQNSTEGTGRRNGGKQLWHAKNICVYIFCSLSWVVVEGGLRATLKRQQEGPVLADFLLGRFYSIPGLKKNPIASGGRNESTLNWHVKFSKPSIKHRQRPKQPP